MGAVIVVSVSFFINEGELIIFFRLRHFPVRAQCRPSSCIEEYGICSISPCSGRMLAPLRKTGVTLLSDFISK